MNIRIAGIIRVILAAWSALLCLPAVAATYYVDYVNGNDTNTGAAITAPWQHCPGDSVAAGKVASNLNPGDVILFHGGVTYGFTPGANGYINIANSGLAGAPITYRSGHLANPAWGSTPAFINASNAGAAGNGVINVANWVSNIVIDGFAMANQTNNNDYVGLIGTGYSGGNLTVEDCILTNGAGCGIYIQGYGNPNPSGFCVSNCFIQYLNWHGIFFRYGLDNAMITNCWVHYTGMPIYPGGGAGDNICLYCGATTIMNNIFIDGNDLGTTPTKGCLLAETPATGLCLRGNYCHGTNQTGGFMFNGCMTNVLCCNNVWNLTIAAYQGIYRFNADVTQVMYEGFKVYNDTIVANVGNGAIFYMIPGDCTNNVLFDNLDIRNCIIDGSQGTVPLMLIDMNTAGTGLIVNTNTFTCDYNVYNPEKGFPYFLAGGSGQGGYGATTYTLSSWQSFLGQDAHSTTNAPAYASYSGGNFQLSSADAIAVNAGMNLYSYLQADKNGVPRPASRNWSIGAYQGPATAVTGPAAPIGLHVIAGP